MRILVTLDGSEFAEAAIPVARRLATSESEVHLLTVVHPESGHPSREAGVGVPDAPETTWQNGHDDEFEAPSNATELIVGHYLEQVARMFPENVVHPALRVGPYAAEQIIAYADANEVDMVVMATHGRSGIDHLVHGSVAGRVLRAGVAPVALVRPSRVA